MVPKAHKREEVNMEIDENYRIHDLVWHKMYKIGVDSFSNTKMPIQSQITMSGSGFTIPKNNVSHIEGSRGLPDEATVFQAELMAIRQLSN